ncbi:MAG: hypothetical protein JSU66_10575, partial [Deltaproteobacteria bacterium]
MSPTRVGVCALVLLLAPGVPAAGQESDAVPGAPFAEGEVIAFEQIARLEPYLPPAFWAHRERFFFE